VDFGDLAVGDRWADLAVASMSLDWNFGEGHQPEFFAAYGIEPDERASAGTARSGTWSPDGAPRHLPAPPRLLGWCVRATR
jgi:aminoglycoside phosphotransferase (APT) family kinase protein